MRQNRTMRSSDDTEMSKGEICLGVVITAEFERLDEAMQQLEEYGALELGSPHGNRIPASLITTRGMDRDLIAAIEVLPAVSWVEVAFAQVIEEEES